MNLRIHRPSGAMIVAILALIVAMSGSAYAIQRVQSGDSLVAKRTLSGNRLRLNTVTRKEVAEGTLRKVPKANLAYHLPALVWHKLTLVNDWHTSDSFRAPAWAVDAQGIVHFRGAMSEALPTSATFTTLPAAIRPAKDVDVETGALNAAPARLNIMPNGSVVVQDTAGGANARGFTSLDGVTFSR